jgi:hypothetical protein
VNRQQRRAQARRDQKIMARARKDMSRADYDPAKDPHVRDGIAKIVRGVDFVFPEEFAGGGQCLFRALTGLEVMRRCNIEARLHAGSLLYRVGPDPMRDVVAFCGPDNAGFTSEAGACFHIWLDAGDDIVDFSVGDWPSLQVELTRLGAPELGPIQWTILKPPEYWWKPRATNNWRSTGTAPLGEAWYGPFNADPFAVQQAIKKAQRNFGPRIADAVDRIFQPGNIAERPLSPTCDPAIIETATIPQGYQRTTVSEIFRIAGAAGPAEMRDAEAYVTEMPATPEAAIALLKNMTITVPPSAK